MPRVVQGEVLEVTKLEKLILRPAGITQWPKLLVPVQAPCATAKHNQFTAILYCRSLHNVAISETQILMP